MLSEDLQKHAYRMFILEIAWIWLLLGFTAANAKSSQLERKHSDANSVLTISTNSTQEFLVFILNLQNDVWVNIDKVFVSMANSRQISHNKTYPTFSFYVWSLPIFERHCEETLEKHFNLTEKVNYTLQISSSHLNESEVECSFTQTAKRTNYTAWIILGVLVGLMLLFCLLRCICSANNTRSDLTGQNDQTRRDSSTQTSSDYHHRHLPRFVPFQQTWMNRPLSPQTRRVTYQTQNREIPIQGHRDEGENGTGSIRPQRNISYRDFSSTVTYNYVKYAQEDCPICICELVENELIMRLPCLHLFHKSCIDKWFQESTLCPICRADVIARQEDSDS